MKADQLYTKYIKLYYYILYWVILFNAVWCNTEWTPNLSHSTYQKTSVPNYLQYSYTGSEYQLSIELHFICPCSKAVPSVQLSTNEDSEMLNSASRFGPRQNPIKHKISQLPPAGHITQPHTHTYSKRESGMFEKQINTPIYCSTYSQHSFTRKPLSFWAPIRELSVYKVVLWCTVIKTCFFLWCVHWKDECHIKQEDKNMAHVIRLAVIQSVGLPDPTTCWHTCWLIRQARAVRDSTQILS